MAERLPPKKQGDLGEADAIAVLTRLGGEVSVPIFSSPDYDVVVDFGCGLQRVQVKTSGCRNPRGRFQVQLATLGGNQSWSGCTKHFDRSRCDILFVVVSDGRRWLIPAPAVDGRTAILLGGPKYSEYLLDDPGDRPINLVGSPLECREPRGGAGVGEPGRPVKSVASPEWVRFPPPPSSDAPTSLVLVKAKEASVGRSRISSGHQMTIPIGPFRAAQLTPGDRFEVTAEGPGSLRIERIHAARVTVGSNGGPDHEQVHFDTTTGGHHAQDQPE